ncbi:hypothetical protein Moror_17888 [Moniliophthora roreri MCA 2997]|uniref:TM7S3/TM198-like domain-containing protein n=2 Tax=Moniliophthora roreri TaxID=221103 RepID=V2XTY9_MONRO|nr:hypothetical protein Moror_17888 [Moniliophthora roreri MCA 2997]KAI3612073.1 hypothetical protein WG66_016084 [Moniliophthora roreri]
MRRRLPLWSSFTFTLCNCIIPSYAQALASLQSRVLRDVVINKAADGSTFVIDKATNQVIPQGPATDGSGKDFDTPALIWIIYCIALGLPLALAGIRGWRLTTGVGISVAAAVSAWAALINSVNEVGVSDVLLTLTVVGFSFLGFIFGVFKFAQIGGIVGMTVAGGVAFGVRIVLLKERLLISAENFYAANWGIISVLGVVAGLLLVRYQRPALLFGCSSVGTFLVFLGVDLMLNRQSGLSRGLRFLFDRNTNHLADILSNGYEPSITTQILLALSLVLTPILAYAQHRIFSAPFDRTPRPSDEELGVNYPTNLRTAFPGLWDTAKFKAGRSRFSL